MSTLKFSSNTSGTGTFTIVSPNSSTDRQLYFADRAGQIPSGPGTLMNATVFEYSGGDENFSAASWTDSTNMTTTYTPSSASHKVLIIADLSFMVYNSSSNVANSRYRISRNSEAATSTYSSSNLYDYGNSGIIQTTNVIHTWLDSPATTSAITYTLQVYFVSGTAARLNYNTGTSRFTFFEVAT